MLAYICSYEFTTRMKRARQQAQRIPRIQMQRNKTKLRPGILRHDSSRFEALLKCSRRALKCFFPSSYTTVDTSIKESTFLCDSLLKALIFCPSQSIYQGWGKRGGYSRHQHKRTYIFMRQPVKGSYILPFTIHILGMGEAWWVQQTPA